MVLRLGLHFGTSSSVINRILSSSIICAKVEMDAYLEGHVFWSHSVSTEVIHLRNDVMYFSDTWCSRLDPTLLNNAQCSRLTNTGNFPHY